MNGCKGQQQGYDTHNVDTNDLARGLLDLLQLAEAHSVNHPKINRLQYAPKEVPEPRLGDNFVRREDAHAVNLGVGLTLGGEVATDDLVFLERHLGGVRQ